MSKERMKALTLVFLRREGEVLLAMKKRGFGAGRWNGVGGKLEPGETVEQALVRETWEEIGVKLLSYDKVAQISFDELYNGERTTMNVTVYTSDSWEGEPTESEEMRPEWYRKDEVPYDDMWPDDVYWLPTVLAEDAKIRASFTLDEHDTIVSHDVQKVAEL